jgi:hypothetical protein
VYVCVCGCFALCACAVMLQAEFYVPLKFAEAAILALQPVAGSMSGWQPSDAWVGWASLTDYKGL